MRVLDRIFRGRGRPVSAPMVSGAERFDPLRLFAANEPGVWYDPSDLSTLFQDSAGTTPVTAVEQPVGLMLDKSKGLTLGPELVVNGTFDTNTSGWVGNNANATMTWQPTGSALFRNVADFVYAQSVANLGLITGRLYKVSFDILAINHTSASIHVGIGGSGNLISSTIPKSYTYYHLATGNSTFQIRPNSAGVGTIQIDNISVRELPGNHAYQATAVKRPVLSARVNLLTKTERFDDAAWVKNNATITANTIVAPDGTLTADKFTPSAGVGNATVSQVISVEVAPYTYTFRAKAAEQSLVSLVSNLTGTFSANVFNLSAQTALPGTGWTASITPDPAGGGWFICSCSATANTAASKSFQISNNAAGWTGDGTSGIYIWGADLRVANDGAGLPAYQRVNTATDYDTVGFPHYLRFDGVDDFLVTPTITPGTDKAQVFAGVRKLSDAAVGMLAELSVTSTANNGVFALFAPNAASTYALRSRGTTDALITSAASYASPITNVIAGIGDISGDRATLHINGAQAAQNLADQGTGNYLAYPLYIGRRGDTTLPFNGRLYSLIVRFGSNLPTATIEQTEKYINTKTRAY